MTKKSWVTPELIILIRSNPEEAVLLTCKVGNNVGPGAPGNCQGATFCQDNVRT
jgi:hypothetical protein